MKPGHFDESVAFCDQCVWVTDYNCVAQGQTLVRVVENLNVRCGLMLNWLSARVRAHLPSTMMSSFRSTASPRLQGPTWSLVVARNLRRDSLPRQPQRRLWEC